MRAHDSHLVRGVHLIEVTTRERLERLRRTLAGRFRRSLEVDPPLLRAGVLVPLIPGPRDIELLLTRRTDTVLSHKGQISFPGGQQEATDQGITETALRETYEEIGLHPSRIDVLGALDDVFTAVSGYVVTPVVGVVSGSIADLVLAPHEVKSLLVVPVNRLLAPEVHTTQTRSLEGHDVKIHYYAVGDDVIWGATGRMLYQFLKAWNAAG